MKKIMLPLLFCMGISATAAAQTSGGQSSNGPSVSSPAAKSKKGKSVKGKKALPPDSLDQRKTYEGKNGQRATPTGHQATGTGGGYSAIRKDSATAPRDSTKQ